MLYGAICVYIDLYWVPLCGMTGMNLLSKFCIAVSATRKLNCVAVGVICVAAFFFGVLEKKNS